jgi:molybdenum cofactor cytidylyltransferase
LTIVGILLAAGRGSRFDTTGTHNKLLQALADGETILVASARRLLAAVPKVVAVLRPGDQASAGLLQSLGCQVVVCEHAASGMAASLVCGIRCAQDASGWLIALADMPYVQVATLVALRRAVEAGASIAVPLFDGRRGNPVAFADQHLVRLLALAGDQGARSIVKNYPVKEVMVDDPGILQDIDTPSDIKNEKQ